METEPRMFSAPDMGLWCARAARVGRLRGVELAVLRMGEPFPLRRLAVAAFDSSGSLVPSVPVTIEVELVSPSVIFFISERLAQGLTAHASGVFRIRVRTICPGPSAEVTITAVAAHR